MKSREKKSYAVFGLGEFGRSVALELMACGAEVMVIDQKEDRIAEMAEKVTLAMEMDAVDIRSYESLGLSNMDGVIVAMTGCLDACIMAILAAKEAGVPFILAKSQNRTQSVIFEKIGADRIVTPEHDGGIRVARNIIAGNFLDFIELSQSVSMVETAVKPEWFGKSLRELSLRQKHRINVVAIRRDGELNGDVNPEDPLRAGDTILIIINKRYLEELME